MTSRFPALEALLREVEAKAEAEPDVLTTLIAVLKEVIRTEVDPYLLTGALIEGIVTTLMERIPAETQRDVGVQTVRLLRDRLSARGVA